MQGARKFPQSIRIVKIRAKYRILILSSFRFLAHSCSLICNSFLYCTFFPVNSQEKPPNLFGGMNAMMGLHFKPSDELVQIVRKPLEMLRRGSKRFERGCLLLDRRRRVLSEIGDLL